VDINATNLPDPAQDEDATGALEPSADLPVAS
jgi:hypothetical protein